MSFGSGTSLSAGAERPPGPPVKSLEVAAASGAGPRRRQWTELAGWLVPTLFTAVLVFSDLGSRSLWLDESYTFTVASQHGAHLWRTALADDGNMVAYYLGMHYWVALFGSSETSLRTPSALAAVGTMPVCFFLLRRLFDLRAAVLGTFLLAASAPFVWYAQDARAYIVQVFFVSAATLAFVVGVQKNRLWAWALYAVLAAAAVYMLVLSALVVVAQALALVLRRHGPRRWLSVPVAWAAVGLFLVPIAWVIADNGTGVVEWLPRPGPVLGADDRYLLEFITSARVGGYSYSTLLAHAITAATVIAWAVPACLFFYHLLRRRDGDEDWGYGLLLSWLVLPPILTWAISVTVQPVLADRYIISSLPPASMLVGVALSRVQPKVVAAVVGVALAVARLAVAVPLYGVPLEGWRQMVAEVAARSQRHDCMALFVSDVYTAVDYYVLRSAKLPATFPVPVLPEASWRSRSPFARDPAIIPVQRLPEVAAACPRLWLVRSHDLGYPPAPGVLPYRALVYERSLALNAEVRTYYQKTSTLSFPGGEVSLYVRAAPAPSHNRARPPGRPAIDGSPLSGPPNAG